MSTTEEKNLLRVKKIGIKIHVDDNSLPEKLEWNADDNPMEKDRECKAFFMHVWDTATTQAMQIDLWSKEMTIEEMNHFMFQTLATLGDVYRRATGNQQSAEDIKNLAFKFAQDNQVMKKKA